MEVFEDAYRKLDIQYYKLQDLRKFEDKNWEKLGVVIGIGRKLNCKVKNFQNIL